MEKSELNVEHVTLGICQTNSYFVYLEGSDQAVIIDPAERGDYLFQCLKEKGLKLAGILLTHGHFDHIGGCEVLKTLSGCKIYAPKDEIAMCQTPSMNLSDAFEHALSITPDVLLTDGEEFTLAEMNFKMLETPGHTSGSCCYYMEQNQTLFSGDTLFCESIGRTDFPTGSMSSLVRCVKEKLMVLPEETKVYPGHSEETSIGHEKKYNPYCQ